MHFTDLPLHPFFECFSHPTVLTFSSTAKKISDIFLAVDEKVKTVKCNKESKKGCNGKSTKCITHYLWDELELHINSFFERKNLNDLINNTNNRI